MHTHTYTLTCFTLHTTPAVPKTTSTSLASSNSSQTIDSRTTSQQMSSNSSQHLMGLEQVTDRAKSGTVQTRGSSSSEQQQPPWDAQAMYNQVMQQQQAQQHQLQHQQQQQKFLPQEADNRFLIIDPSSGAVMGTTNSSTTSHTERPAARNISTDSQEKERLAVAASSGLYAPYNFPAPQKRVSSAIFSSELMNSPYFSVDEAMSSGSGSILAFPAASSPATMDKATAAAALQEGLASGIDDYHLLLLAQAAGLMDESGNLLPAFGGQGGECDTHLCQFNREDMQAMTRMSHSLSMTCYAHLLASKVYHLRLTHESQSRFDCS